MEKFDENLEKAGKSFKLADHMVYVTFPVVQENRLLLKVLEEIHNSLVYSVNALLQYEYFYKRIQLYRSPRENFKTFEELAEKYAISQEQVNRILEVFNLADKHKKSPMEFVKNDKIVIMNGSMQIESFDLRKIKRYLNDAKEILKKTENIIRNRL